MKKTYIIIFILIVILLLPNYTYANNETEEISSEEIISSQKETLNISKFLEEAKKYTIDSFEDLNY